ncbi:hypothetical protein BOX15_Mlig025119g1 [Macrostomum lignano]|uniref:Uncharacterized protein n=1 Tax=Macrostomum lignano TaxID=282301 RepID=A0A267FHV6_9PLAT|nr:hypothetical protein BOX15_Mlig025119g3 [Macrostomum lignano]PAA49006.1 hypothetical protein BOX15_Mlig025119g2 [Macrostomum lignano]PAA73348.1 hypothetical protein BOX15_Mlig025119g1 [Macrostomum lignano]
MRSANLLLFLGTIGFINIYEDLMGDDDISQFDASDAKKLQKKFGVKEKRSAIRKLNPQSELKEHFEDYTEELVEFLKRPLFRSLRNCGKVSETGCNCLKLICFGQAECVLNVTSTKLSEGKKNNGPVHLPADDPRYVYYVTSKRLRARHNSGAPWQEQNSAAEAARAAEEKSERQQFLKCRQTTINPYVLCDCKKYTRL